MHVLADNAYATNISGYVITALLAVLTAGFASHSAYIRKRIDTQDKSLSAQNASMAVLLAALPATTTRMDTLETRTRTLEVTTAVLVAQLGLTKGLQQHDSSSSSPH